MDQVAEGVWRLGTRFVNWYVLDDGGRLTVFDTGLPRHFPQLGKLLQELGRQPADIQAIVLTHAHPDHYGTAERIRAESGAPVWIHEDDAAVVTGEEKGEMPNFWPYVRYPAMTRYLLHVARDGVLRPPPVARVETFRDGDRLDVPGAPRVVAVPGHTRGHCALFVEDRGVLFGGDSLSTVDPLKWSGDPHLAPRGFHADPDQALRSISAIESIDADPLLPGHGDPWRKGVAEAVRLARDAGVR